MATTTTPRPSKAKAAEIVTLGFVIERETKGTYRYAEVVADDGDPRVGTLYVKKAAAAALGNPSELRVTIAAHVAA